MTDNRDIFIQLLETKKLPTPSETALDVMRLCQDDSASLNDIAERIQTDPALSAELIKYANSAFLSTGIQVASVQKATVKLGIKTVVNLALGFSLISHNKAGKCQSFNYTEFWSRSLTTALAAKTIAGHVPAFNPEELFICGLLAHMGELAFATLFPKEYSKILDRQLPSLETKQQEKKAFEIDSAELTVELFLDWGLPAHFALAAGYHEDLDADELGESTTKKVAELLNLAEQIAILCHNRHPTPRALEEIEDAATAFNIEKQDFKAVFDEIINLRHDWSSRSKIAAIHCPTYDALKAGPK
jgi:HD-like signal output (HDOD) protein